MAVSGAIPVRFEDVFAGGVFAVGVEAVRDFEKSSKEQQVQARDKQTGQLLWAVEVLDLDSQTRAAERQAKVKIAAAHQPVLPDPLPGVGLRSVEFEGLAVRPYVNGNGRLAYSYTAKAVKAPGGKPQPQNGKGSPGGGV